jgi:dihydrofolate reductase
MSKASAEWILREWGEVDAIVTGRRDFDVSNAWGGTPPLSVPIFIVTHHPPEEWIRADSPFTFVTDGVENAVAQAKQAAGGKDVHISGSQIIQQSLRAGLVDEIASELAHILPGDGIRLFENLGDVPIALLNTGIVDGKGVTHLRFRVVK